jgi:hypothetical protein
MGLFESDETIGKSMVVWFKSLLSKFGLMHHVIAFVRNEGNNLSTMAIALYFIIICQPLKFKHDYEGTYFGHVMSKACQYATNDDKVFLKFNASKCEGCTSYFTKEYYMDEKNLIKVGKNGRRLVLNVGCCLKTLKPLSKPDLHPKSSRLKRPWNSNKLSSLVIKGK